MSVSTQIFAESLEYRLEKVGNLIGNTPLLPIRNIFKKKGVQIFAKLEWQQLGGSVKSRPAYAIIKDAILKGDLFHNIQLLDATSGNTGIAYATVCKALGIPVTLCLPENASPERKKILLGLGVEIVYTSRFDGTDGAQLTAKSLYAAQPDRYYYADQYANDNNWKAHFYGTANEIWQQTRGKISHFVAGLGTTGTFTGTGRRLKQLNKDINLVSLQPDNPMHGLEGWKHLETAMIPSIYDDSLADASIEIDTLDSYALIREFSEKEGILLSPSAAANLAGAIKVASELDKGVVVTTFSDNADKYGEVLKLLAL